MKKSISVHWMIRLISLTIFIASTVVIYGWLSGRMALVNLTALYIPMKFITAFAFLLSSVSLLAMSFTTKQQNLFRLNIIVAGSLLIFLFMATIFLSNLLKISTGLESLLVQESSSTTIYSAPGQPSLYTILSFALFSFACLVYLSSRPIRKTLIKIISVPIIFIGIISIIGFILDIPVLYNVWPGISTAIALNTALLFSLLGLGLLLVGYTL